MYKLVFDVFLEEELMAETNDMEECYCLYSDLKDCYPEFNISVVTKVKDVS